MALYKVLSPFTFRGAHRVGGDVIELTETKLAKLVQEGFGDKVRPVDQEEPKKEDPTPIQTPTSPIENPQGSPEGFYQPLP